MGKYTDPGPNTDLEPGNPYGMNPYQTGRGLTPEQYQKAQLRVSQGLGALGGVGALAGQWSGMIGEAKKINTNAPSGQVDFMGRPTYNLGNFATNVNAIKPQGATGGEIIGGGLQRATAGAAFGPLGAAIGAVVGAGGTAIAGGVRKRKMDAKKRLAQNNLFAAQQLYNKSIASFNQSNLAQASYNDMSNIQNRIQNLYTFN